ncbi:MAG: thioredoxin domain-containing protein, partial [Exiguobacterium sp.]|nr:thioredoxin domain-containing protein [Exiguobacterium sp.]
MKKNQLLAILTIVAVALIALVFVLLNQDDSTTAERGDHVSIEGQPTLGNPDAKVSVVEFGDYKCPSCKQWGETIYPQLKADYLDKEDVSFSYINVLFH